MVKNNIKNACLVVIGNEILTGRTQDKNIAFISNWLNLNCGIAVKEVRIIQDVEKIIINNVYARNETAYKDTKYKSIYQKTLVISE